MRAISPLHAFNRNHIRFISNYFRSSFKTYVELFSIIFLIFYTIFHKPQIGESQLH